MHTLETSPSHTGSKITWRTEKLKLIRQRNKLTFNVPPIFCYKSLHPNVSRNVMHNIICYYVYCVSVIHMQHMYVSATFDPGLWVATILRHLIRFPATSFNSFQYIPVNLTYSLSVQDCLFSWSHVASGQGRLRQYCHLRVSKYG